MYKGPEIYRRMHAFPATTQSMLDAHSVINELGKIHQNVVDAFKKAQGVITEGWKGGAADAASSGLNPHIQAAGVVAEQLNHSANSLTDQAQAFHKAAGPLVKMDNEPPGTWGIGDILSIGASDDEIKAAQWETDNSFNISQYNGYQQAAAVNNVPAQQVFVSPQENFVGMASTAVMQSHGGGATEHLGNPQWGRTAGSALPVSGTTPVAVPNQISGSPVAADHGVGGAPGFPVVHSEVPETTRTSASAFDPTGLGVESGPGTSAELLPNGAGKAGLGSGSSSGGVPDSGGNTVGPRLGDGERELGGGRRTTSGLPSQRGVLPGNASTVETAARGSSATNAMSPGGGAGASEGDREHKKKVMIFAEDPESLFGGSEEKPTVPVIGLSTPKSEKSRFRSQDFSGDS